MISYLSDDFRDLFKDLPDSVKQQARKKYRLWKQNPNHPSLYFKRIHTKEAIFSIRIGLGWRALGLAEGDFITWFWIGSHSDYDSFIAQM